MTRQEKQVRQTLLGALEAIRDMESKTGNPKDTLALCRAVARAAVEHATAA